MKPRFRWTGVAVMMTKEDKVHMNGSIYNLNWIYAAFGMGESTKQVT